VLQPLLLVGLRGLTAPLAWLARLGDLRVAATAAEHQQPSAGLRLRRDEATILVWWHWQPGRPRRARSAGEP
jgi:hypothetical protein